MITLLVSAPTFRWLKSLCIILRAWLLNLLQLTCNCDSAPKLDPFSGFLQMTPNRTPQSPDFSCNSPQFHVFLCI